MKKIEDYKGIEIYTDNSDRLRPITTIQHNVPVMGTLQNGHKSIEDAKKFIDSIVATN